jgi:hypothetical protein
VDNDHLEFLLARDGIPSDLAEVDQAAVPQILSVVTWMTTLSSLGIKMY